MLDQEDRPVYVTFEYRAIEDRSATLKAGHFVPKDDIFAIITPPGGNLTVEKLAEEWLTDKRNKNDPFFKHYQSAYEAWKDGQELPTEGTPIKTCPIFSPSEIQRVISANIKTVEDLAQASEEALQRIGMGARAIKAKAVSYMDASKDGKAAGEIQTLRRDNEALTELVKELQDQVGTLRAQVDASKVEAPKKRGRPKKETE